MRDSNCIFCKIAAGEIPSNTIYEDDEFKVFLDISPATKGHALIVPKQHYKDIYDIDEEVAIKRYRRIGSEGIETEKVDVLSTTYNTENDFNEYLPIMNTYKKRKSGKGFRFI